MGLVGAWDDLDPQVADEVLELLELARDAPPDRQLELKERIEARLRWGSPSRMAMATSDGAWRPYPHLVLLNDHLRQLAERKIKRLLVTMPPQHGKSWTSSKHFPAWYFHRFPDHRIILTSYEADFAASWGGQVRELIEENEDLLGLSVRQSSRAKKRWDLVGHQGGMWTAGVGGPITGKGANLLVIDDPVKNKEEAASEEYQRRNWDWYNTTAYSRLKRHPDDDLEPVVLLIQTRWHEADLAGKIVDEHGDQWTVLNLPALAEDDDALGRERGEALCPELHPRDELENTRETVTVSAWSALWQQRPAPEGGGRFRKETFRYWTTVQADEPYYKLTAPAGLGEVLIAKSECWRFTCVDLAATTKKRSDYSVISVWDVAPPRIDLVGRECPSLLILVDRFRERVESADHGKMLSDADVLYKPAWHGVEKATYGLSLITSAVRKGLRVQPLDADNDKWARSEIAGVMCTNGRVFFPHSAWLGEWEHELLMFPDGAHDDQVDTLSYAAIELDKRPMKPRKPKEELTTRQRLLRASKVRRIHPVLGRL